MAGQKKQDFICYNPARDYTLERSKYSEIINLYYLFKEADEIWESECESEGDAGSATRCLVNMVVDDLCNYIPTWAKGYEGWEKPYELLAQQIVAAHVKNFGEYEEQSQGETALQEAELDIRYETMRSL